ncbi:hypothetical protein B0T11DRAFT_289256 [Plectosphaerella cucumerina]|uniref:Uncharacterized protein n=1 Tax=Plectosphaerella cucumerina TaxID=40658 RepID=A0A8K0T353_9PEZI|nr:hypothetical protein B0T11DRAFT_289256 [Plectosphaerella cucumerina]
MSALRPSLESLPGGLPISGRRTCKCKVLESYAVQGSRKSWRKITARGWVRMRTASFNSFADELMMLAIRAAGFSSSASCSFHSGRVFFVVSSSAVGTRPRSRREERGGTEQEGHWHEALGCRMECQVCLYRYRYRAELVLWPVWYGDFPRV